MTELESINVGCTVKELSEEDAIAAAQTAIEQNPTNQLYSAGLAKSGIILSPQHLAVLTSKHWGSSGVRLTTGFMESISNELKNRILSHMNAWREYANAEFVLASDPVIRITLQQQGYWSFLGTDNKHIPKNQATMCFQAFNMGLPESEFKRVVRHEAGHALGFPHEHARLAIVNRLDHQKTINHFQITQGWSAAQTQQQILNPIPESAISGTVIADEESIMAYTFPGSCTKDGLPILGGKDFSQQDIIAVGKIYPRAGNPNPPPQPPPSSNNFASVFFYPDNKEMIFDASSGWTVKKKSHTEQGAVVMNNLDLVALSFELESSLPKAGAELDAAKSSAIGGTIAKVIELIAAMRARDWVKITAIVLELMNELLGSVKPNVDGDGVVISFQAQAMAARFDWSKLKGILLKLLPFIFGA